MFIVAINNEHFILFEYQSCMLFVGNVGKGFSFVIWHNMFKNHWFNLKINTCLTVTLKSAVCQYQVRATLPTLMLAYCSDDPLRISEILKLYIGKLWWNILFIEVVSLQWCTKIKCYSHAANSTILARLISRAITTIQWAFWGYFYALVMTFTMFIPIECKLKNNFFRTIFW